MLRKIALQSLAALALIVGPILQGVPLPGDATFHEETSSRVATINVVEQTTNSLWHAFTVDVTIALNNVVAAFQTSHPTIQVDTQYVPFDDLRGAFETAMASGQGPTLLIGPSDWGPSFFDDGLVADVSSFASANLLASMNQAALGAVRYKGALIGLPHQQKGVIMYRNKSIIPDAVVTYQALIAVAQEASHGDVVGANLERGFFFAAAHLHGLGGQLMSTLGCPAFASQKGVDWLNLLDSFDDAGPTQYYTDNDVNLFKAGKVGFIIDGTWNIPSISAALGTASVAIDPGQHLCRVMSK